MRALPARIWPWVSPEMHDTTTSWINGHQLQVSCLSKVSLDQRYAVKTAFFDAEWDWAIPWKLFVIVVAPVVSKSTCGDRDYKFKIAFASVGALDKWGFAKNRWGEWRLFHFRFCYLDLLFRQFFFFLHPSWSRLVLFALRRRIPLLTEFIATSSRHLNTSPLIIVIAYDFIESVSSRLFMWQPN